MEPKDYDRGSHLEITERIKGEVIEAVEQEEEGGDDLIVFRFRSGHMLRIRYDWIYDWELRDS